MYWRSEKEIIDDFVKVLRRIFTYVETLTNKDKELLVLPTGSIVNAIFESYASISEEYPQIRVDSGGMSYIDHLNNLVTINGGAETPLGFRPLKRIVASHDFPVEVTLPPSMEGVSVRGFIIPCASTVNNQGDDVDVELIEATTIYTPTPVVNFNVRASGSLSRNPSTQYLNSFANISPQVTISDTSTWSIKLTPQIGDEYIFGIDEDNAQGISYVYYENGLQQIGNGILHANAVSTPFIRIGAGIEGSILIKCSSKDDSKTPRNLASTIAIYCNLLKQAQIRRKETGYYADKLQLIFGTDEEYNEWLEKGIRIKSIRQNPMNYRRRSSNEIIYESAIVIDVATEWFQDFQANNLEEIDVEIYSLLQQINAEINKDTIIVKNNYDEN